MSIPVSVVMAVYNGRKFLREQVESVLAQLDADDELVIVDDASTDDSAALLRELQSPLITLVTNPANLGVTRTFQRGLELARHDIVFLCDQDDVWLPGKKAAFVAAFASDPDVMVVVSDAKIVDSNGAVLADSYMQTVRRGFSGSALSTLWRNCYLGCSMAVRRTVLQFALPIPPKVPMHDMWLGAVASICGRPVFLPTPYLRHRRHGDNATTGSRHSLHRIIGWRIRFAGQLIRRIAAVRLGVHKV